MLPRPGLRFDDLLRREIRAAEEAHLSVPHQLVERAQGFLDWRLRVRAMQLVKIDPIGTQPLQARLDRVHDIAPRRPLELAGLIHRHAELAREHDRFALLAENASEALLRAAFVAVAVGGVDQVDAELDRLTYDPARRREIDAAAEVVAAEADDGHFKRGAAEPAFFHRRIISLRAREPEDLPRLVGSGDLAPQPARDAYHALHQHGIVLGEFAWRDIGIVLVADAHVSAERDRERENRPLLLRVHDAPVPDAICGRLSTMKWSARSVGGVQVPPGQPINSVV